MVHCHVVLAQWNVIALASAEFALLTPLRGVHLVVIPTVLVVAVDEIVLREGMVLLCVRHAVADKYLILSDSDFNLIVDEVSAFAFKNPTAYNAPHDVLLRTKIARGLVIVKHIVDFGLSIRVLLVSLNDLRLFYQLNDPRLSDQLGVSLVCLEGVLQLKLV
jgi:hypothetical protein